MTRSELFLVMTGGMAGIAGTVLVLYATLLAPLIPDAAAHFVIASVLGAPDRVYLIGTAPKIVVGIYSNHGALALIVVSVVLSVRAVRCVLRR